MLSNILCTSDEIAVDIEDSVNEWYQELNEAFQKDLTACIAALREGDPIMMAGHTLVKEGDALRLLEH